MYYVVVAPHDGRTKVDGLATCCAKRLRLHLSRRDRSIKSSIKENSRHYILNFSSEHVKKGCFSAIKIKLKVKDTNEKSLNKNSNNKNNKNDSNNTNDNDNNIDNNKSNNNREEHRFLWPEF